MKTFTLLQKSLFCTIAVMMVAVSLFIFTGCEKCDPAENASSNTGDVQEEKPITKINIVLPFFVEGAGSEWWANLTSNDNLYEERTHSQIFGPDGHPVTWGEFNRATGQARINCTGQGTRLNIRMSGLIPNGVYSIWCMQFQSPGFDTAYTNVSGFGAAGAADGSENSFVASSQGDANFHVSCPAGALSVSGSISGCIPSDEYELHFVGIYHLDKQAHGATPGAAGSYVEQFAFIISNH